jgi:hypothetical protein
MAKNSPKRPFFSYSVKVKVLTPKSVYIFVEKKLMGLKSRIFINIEQFKWTVLTVLALLRNVSTLLPLPLPLISPILVSSHRLPSDLPQPNLLLRQ